MPIRSTLLLSASKIHNPVRFPRAFVIVRKGLLPTAVFVIPVRPSESHDDRASLVLLVIVKMADTASETSGRWNSECSVTCRAPIYVPLMRRNIVQSNGDGMDRPPVCLRGIVLLEIGETAQEWHLGGCRRKLIPFSRAGKRMAKAPIMYVPPSKEEVKIMSTVRDGNSSSSLRQSSLLERAAPSYC